MECKMETGLVEAGLWMIYLLKLNYDVGNMGYINEFSGCIIGGDDYYVYIWEALELAAPISEMMPVIGEDGEEIEETDIYIWRFSSEEMKRCYRILRLIQKMSDKGTERNSRIEALNQEIDSLKHFYSYSFDYDFQIENRNAYIEVRWDCEFGYELHMCIWITKAMKAYRELLPELEGELSQLFSVRKKKDMVQNEELTRSAA